MPSERSLAELTQDLSEQTATLINVEAVKEAARRGAG